MYKGDLLKKEDQQQEVRTEIEKLEKAMVAEKAAGVLMPEFLEFMDKVAHIIASTDAMPELDFCIKKLFSNFSVSRKNVENATLCEPFVGLIDPKDVMGAG